MFEIRNFEKQYWPQKLREIPQPPQRLRIVGKNPDPEKKFLCIVGPRKHSIYSKAVCEKLIKEIRGYPICIVSGLAYGIDSVAHRLAIENNLETVAFPGSGLLEENIYPRAHLNLAKEIVEAGGALISEFDDNFSATNWAFPQRNRLMVAISDAVLVIETKEKSGTMITSRLTLDYNRDLLVPPGSIFEESCRGANDLIKEGAYPITSGADIIEIFGLEKIENQRLFAKSDFTKNELLIYEKISTPTTTEELILKTGLKINEINEVLTLLELKDLIFVVDGKICQK